MNSAKTKTNTQKLRGARLCAVQALYQIDLTGKAGKKVVSEFIDHRITDNAQSEDKIYADGEFFQELVKEAVENHIMVDAQISSRLVKGWTLERIDPIVRAALRLATYELMNKLQTPIAVIIDEYVGVVAAFHEGKEPNFVNGILERIAKETKADLARVAPE
ncbi:MAG: transcription antitermination factor NusB [Caulobacterales bacterium]|nr:transcription antitermination factor NusB [Caulobacterales bacterium]MCA0372990.1 transcription antitermination factor NusB [Pseudomonadota bacterium]